MRNKYPRLVVTIVQKQEGQGEGAFYEDRSLKYDESHYQGIPPLVGPGPGTVCVFISSSDSTFGPPASKPTFFS
jgi:hypothetical protein